MQNWNSNRICHFFYELALLFAVAILCLVPFHASTIQHCNVDKIIDPSTVSFTVKDTDSLKLGSTFPVYRFNPEWTSPIGWVKISSIINHEVTASYNSSEFRWPMGRQGRILINNFPRIKVSMGSNLGLKKGDMLCLFEERNLVGKIVLEDLKENEAWGRVLFLKSNVTMDKLTVSEFIYVTQVAVSSNTYMTKVESVLLLSLLFAYLYFFIVRKTSLFIIIGDCLKSRVSLFLKSYGNIITLLLGIPFVWFIINFVPLTFIYLYNSFAQLSFNYLHLSYLPNISMWLNGNSLFLNIIGFLIYILLFIWKRKSPILVFWEAVGYKPREGKFIKGIWRDILIWTLHLIIFYAFGSALLFFLQGNLSAALNLLWPNDHYSLIQLLNFTQIHKSQTLNFEEWCLFLRYLLWSITIVGCLIGYGYSILGYFFGKRIRNLDFTIMGWITNGICYGPLLGFVIWQMSPKLSGLDSIVTPGGLLWYIVLLTELLLNFLYTLSIWNLGNLFGVMTDKGVRTTGFYSVIRHPSYTMESLMFVMIFLNGLSTHYQWFAAGMFIFTYYIRSEREDQFMSQSNPDYKVYQKHTQYKFIPGIY